MHLGMRLSGRVPGCQSAQALQQACRRLLPQQGSASGDFAYFHSEPRGLKSTWARAVGTFFLTTRGSQRFLPDIVDPGLGSQGVCLLGTRRSCLFSRGASCMHNAKILKVQPGQFGHLAKFTGCATERHSHSVILAAQNLGSAPFCGQGPACLSQ